MFERLHLQRRQERLHSIIDSLLLRYLADKVSHDRQRRCSLQQRCLRHQLQQRLLPLRRIVHLHRQLAYLLRLIEKGLRCCGRPQLDRRLL